MLFLHFQTSKSANTNLTRSATIFVSHDFQTTHSKPSRSIFDLKMDAKGVILKVVKDLKIQFEIKEEQKYIIKAIINREDVLPTSIFKSNIDREG